MQNLTINASIYTLVAVALDRYRGIMFPLKGGYSKFRAKLAAALIWAVSITMAVPNLVVYHVSNISSFRIFLWLTTVQSADIGLPTGNENKLSCNQAQLGQSVGLAVA